MMNRILTFSVVMIALLAVAPTASAADAEMDVDAAGGSWVIPGGSAGKVLGASLGAGLIVMGAAKGISHIGGNAVQSIARQPEAGGRIFTSMLLSAALIEGFTFFALLIPFLKG